MTGIDGDILNRNLLTILIWLITVMPSVSQERYIQREPGTRNDFANVFYNPQYTLFDYWSDEPIFPDYEGQYTIYTATNEQKIPVLVMGNAYTISKVIAYKFKSRTNCLNWCNNKTYIPNISIETSSITQSETIQNSDISISEFEIYEPEKPSQTENSTSQEDENQNSKIHIDTQTPQVTASDLKRMDDIAANTSKNYELSMETLTAYFLSQTQNPILLTRLLYTWMAIHIDYNDYGYNTGNYAATDAASVFQSKKAVCSGYSNLFKYLATQMGIECVSISGYSKGYGSFEGERFTKTDHAWNAIKVNSTWHLIDVTWGSGYGKTINGSLVTVKEFDDYWFMTNPDAFIFSHYPEDPQWCLTSINVQKHEFETLPNDFKWLLKLGINPEKILTAALKNNHIKAPKVYRVNAPIGLQEAPIEYTLKNGLLHFKAYCKEPIRLLAKNNDETIEFRSLNNLYTLDLLAKPGNLSISVKLKPSDITNWTLLEYYIE